MSRRAQHTPPPPSQYDDTLEPTAGGEAPCERKRPGMICDKYALLTTLALEPGYWRSNLTSSNVRSCLHAGSCPIEGNGTTGIDASGAFHSDNFCATGNMGPLLFGGWSGGGDRMASVLRRIGAMARPTVCAVCEKGYFFDSPDSGCQPCEEAGKSASVMIPAAALGALMVLAVGMCACRGRRGKRSEVRPGSDDEGGLL